MNDILLYSNLVYGGFMDVQIGAIVNFVMDEGRHAGEIRPAIIVKLWSPVVVQLQVFTDGKNDETDNVIWKTSRHYSTQKQRGTWHLQTDE